MSDADLMGRLAALEKYLEKRVSFVKPQAPDDAPSRGETEEQTPTDQVSQQAQKPSIGATELPTLSQEPEWTTSQAIAMVQPFDCSQFRVGEPLSEEFDFCPWKTVEMYPDFFIGKTNKPRAKPFFSKILQGRVWDFFYMHDARKPLDEPHLLVPTAQFAAFLDMINRAIGTALTIPGGVHESRFYMKFPAGTPRPRYLMRNRDTKTLEIETWPTYHDSDITAYKTASGIRQQDYEENMSLLSRKSSADKSKAAELKAAKRRETGLRMLRNAQSFLRLDGCRGGSDVVLVCFDVEAIEAYPYPVSEIGIAILDVEGICDIPAGPCGRDWWPVIKAHHLRTREYSGLVNRRFVRGCPGAFDFGASKFPVKAELYDTIMSILEPYIGDERDLVLVGHDFTQDVKYLSEVGFEISQLPGVVCQLDSQVLHQCWRDSLDQRGLDSVLADLAMPKKNLHNAGNDAVYTLRAVVGVAIEEMRKRQLSEKGEEYTPALLAE